MAELAAAANGRAGTLDQAIDLVAARTNLAARTNNARRPEAFERSARAGIRSDLIAAGAHTLIAGGATPPQVADLIEPPPTTPDNPAQRTVPASQSNVIAALHPPPSCGNCDHGWIPHDDTSLAPCPTCGIDAPGAHP